MYVTQDVWSVSKKEVLIPRHMWLGSGMEKQRMSQSNRLRKVLHSSNVRSLSSFVANGVRELMANALTCFEVRASIPLHIVGVRMNTSNLQYYIAPHGSTCPMFILSWVVIVLPRRNRTLECMPAVIPLRGWWIKRLLSPRLRIRPIQERMQFSFYGQVCKPLFSGLKKRSELGFMDFSCDYSARSFPFLIQCKL